MIRVSCPKCKAILQVEDKHAGQVIACSNCKTSLRLPQAPPAPPPSPPAVAKSPTPSATIPKAIPTPPVLPAKQAALPVLPVAQPAPAEKPAAAPLARLRQGPFGKWLTPKWIAIGCGSVAVVFVILLVVVVGVFTRGSGGPTGKAPFTNSIGMKFVWIPPGNFMMGSPEEEVKGGTQRKVTLTKGFYMGVYTVTQEEWKTVMGLPGKVSKFEAEKNLPIVFVSWDACQEFIKKLRAKDKKQYRLPTSAEWEYACRAGTTTPFHFGETISTDQANYNGESVYGNGKKGVNRKKTMPVGSFPANAWGLHDMHGNVFQWCQDDEGEHIRVIRGGSYRNFPLGCRSASFGSRGGISGAGDCGFRICFFVE